MKLVAAEHVDGDVLKRAEADSVLATRYFGFQVAWAVVGLALTVVWAPVLGSIDAWVADHIFSALFGSALAIGLSRSLGANIAFIAVVATILVDMVASLAVVAVPLIALGRRSSIAASTGVSLALYVAATGRQLDLSSYPRLNYALRRLLSGVRRSG